MLVLDQGNLENPPLLATIWKEYWLRFMILLGVLGLVYLAICILAYINQDRFVYYPERELTASPVEVRLLYEDITLSSPLRGAAISSTLAWRRFPLHRGQSSAGQHFRIGSGRV
jgi:hypothetical protein